MKELRKSITHKHPIPEVILEDFIAQWEIVTHPKGAILSVPDKTDKYLFFYHQKLSKQYHSIHV
ncbi:hypothetical protein [Saccharicrinis aurantiacus]|uniref:hypothetical protein n=1 Tax=Saccharicrinis aurantiacus TaxID=1849719 RepID=UPI002490DC1B|nr:hypothetical protein [Saccharicrinis aurantiacus]